MIYGWTQAAKAEKKIKVGTKSNLSWRRGKKRKKSWRWLWAWLVEEICDVCVCKRGAERERKENVSGNFSLCHWWDEKVCRSLWTFLLFLPNPIAAQQRTVTIDKVTFKLVIEWAGRGLRSQHLDIKYSRRQNSEMMRAAAGIEPKIPRLCEKKFRL